MLRSKSYFCLLLLCVAKAAHAQIQCPNGVVVYEKSSAISVNPESRPDRTFEVSSTEVPTSTCQRVCDGTPSCTAYTVDYTLRTCKVYSGTILKSRLLPNHQSAFFEKICLPDISVTRFRSMCNGRLWAVERVRGATFNGPVVRLEQNVPNRGICARICLSETNFNCASAIYDEVSRSCSLSSESRRTQPTAFASNDSRSSEYMENHCISDLRDCQYLPQKGSRVVALDHITVAKSEEQCREDCNRNTAIICRAYSYDLTQNSCHLTSDDSVSLQGADLPVQEGLRYAERRCRIAPGAVILQDVSQFQLGGGPQALPLTSSNFNPSQTSYMSNTAIPPYGNVYGNSPNYGQAIPRQFPQNQPGFTASPSQTPYGVQGGTGYNVNPTAYGQSGSFPPFPVNPNTQFNSPRGYPGYGPEGASPRIFNMFRNPYDNSPELGSFATPERCTFVKSTGLAVVSEPQGPIPVTNFGRGVTSQCSDWCRFQGPSRCPAFTLDYTSNQCNVLSRPADVALAPGTIQGQSYFEQTCFPTRSPLCEGKSFAFERFVHFELRGFDDRVLSSVGHIRDCEEACLKETQFQCLSAEYDSSKLECRLSRENKLSRAYAFQQSPSVDYLENQCVPTTTLSTCSPERQDGQALLYADAILVQVYTEDECRRSCQTFPNFTCIAASYRQTDNECSLSNGVTTVARPDSILLYTSCSQPNLVQPTFNNNFGQALTPNGQQYPMGFGAFPYAPQQPFNPYQFTSGFNSPNPGYNPFNQAYPAQYPQFYNGIPGSNTVGQGQSFPNQYPVLPSTIPSSGQFGQQYPISTQFGQQYPISTQFGQQYPASNQYPVSGQFGQQFPAPGQFGQQPSQFYGSGQTLTGRYQPGFPDSGQFGNPFTTGQFGQQFPSSGQFEQQFPGSGQFGQRIPVSGQPGQLRPSVQFSRSGQGSASSQFTNSEGFPLDSNFPQTVLYHDSPLGFPGPPLVSDNPPTIAEDGQPPEISPARQRPSSRRQNSRGSRRRNNENAPERATKVERLTRK